jgi:hypothetical protein
MDAATIRIVPAFDEVLRSGVHTQIANYFDQFHIWAFVTGRNEECYGDFSPSSPEA